MLINCTNHPYSLWSSPQRDAAGLYGEVIDFPFPSVPPDADERQIDCMAEQITGKLMSMDPDAVCCQGEMTLTYRLVARLKEQNVKVIAATSKRVTEETVDSEGKVFKTSEFRFCRFREY